VHGYSLGGSIACHLASKKQLDFLFADRTFSSLSTVGAKSFGSKLRFLFNLLTDWNQNIF